MVEIVVDQLRTDYIEYLRDYFGEGGFKALLADGVYMRDVDFGVSGLDATNATAMLLTGSYPAYTGVPAATIFDPSLPGVPAVLPLASAGNVTNDSFTADNLRLSTLADELKVATGGEARVYSVAMDPQQAVILAGHAGNGALWVNNTSGNWASSSYYGSLPTSVSNRNFRNSLAARTDTMVWKPTPLAQQLSLNSIKKNSPFRYTFPRADRDVYKKFAASPLSNTEVTDVAISLLETMDLGKKQDATDMISVAYTLAPFKYVRSGDGRTELVDSYLRLDGQLARLLQAVKRQVGTGDAVICLSSTGYFDEGIVEEERFRIPGGEFSTKRARSLLNSYLSARHGSAEYVGAIRDGQVFFDHKVLENPRVNASEVISDARSFLVKMSGVSEAYTLEDVLSATTPDLERLRLAADPRHSGDIFVRYTPGWTVANDEQIPTTYKQVRQSAVMTPAILVAPGLSARTVGTTVSAAALAPTVAGFLHIRSPNGAMTRPIDLSTN